MKSAIEHVSTLFVFNINVFDSLYVVNLRMLGRCMCNNVFNDQVDNLQDFDNYICYLC